MARGQRFVGCLRKDIQRPQLHGNLRFTDVRYIDILDRIWMIQNSDRLIATANPALTLLSEIRHIYHLRPYQRSKRPFIIERFKPLKSNTTYTRFSLSWL